MSKTLITDQDVKALVRERDELLNRANAVKRRLDAFDKIIEGAKVIAE